MRQVSRAAALGATLLLACVPPAELRAEDIYNLNQNQNGFDLPGVVLPQGQDEVRAADGTSCSSSIAGSGAYLDVGIIKNERSIAQGGLATYGRVVIPLGKRPKRLDCSLLYRLEVERLQTELRLLKMGLDPAMAEEFTGSVAADAATAAPERRKRKKNWVADGWSSEGR